MTSDYRPRSAFVAWYDVGAIVGGVILTVASIRGFMRGEDVGNLILAYFFLSGIGVALGTAKLSDLSSRYRRYLSFRLSTAVVAMFVASVLLWLNLHPQELSERGSGAPPEYLVKNYYGFPGCMAATPSTKISRTELGSLDSRINGAGWSRTDNDLFFALHGIIGNLAFSLTAIATTAGLYEWLMRKRDRGKTILPHT